MVIGSTDLCLLLLVASAMPRRDAKECRSHHIQDRDSDRNVSQFSSFFIPNP